MSHELRTPLNAILGFTQLLRDYPDQPLSDEQQGHIKQILDGGKHLLGLVNDVLDLARVESGRLAVSLESTDLAQAVRESLVLVQQLAEERDIAVTLDTELASAIFVNADPSRLKQVLLNVLSNAVKYNRDKGSVTVTAKTSGNGMLRISVSDTGSGIAPQKHDEVFRPFSRLGAEASKIEGTGIGLTISRQLIESMGGTLDFESTLGSGSTFWFEVPLAAPGAKA
jgi:signal transduction histidine kinase